MEECYTKIFPLREIWRSLCFCWWWDVRAQALQTSHGFGNRADKFPWISWIRRCSQRSCTGRHFWGETMLSRPFLEAWVSWELARTTFYKWALLLKRNAKNVWRKKNPLPVRQHDVCKKVNDGLQSQCANICELGSFITVNRKLCVCLKHWHSWAAQDVWA